MIRLYDVEINKKWNNFKILSEFGIKVSEFISGISLINSEIRNIKVCLVLNTSSAISSMEIIYFNKDRIF